MIIEYQKNNYVRENKQIEIDDTKNVFLTGKNPYDNLPTYFGIWTNKGTLVIVTIISWRTIDYECYLNTNLHTEKDIQKYLENNNDVKIISKDEFKKQIQHIKKIIEI